MVIIATLATFSSKPRQKPLAPLTKKIISCGIEVHRELGPGLLESVYQECMVAELKSANLEVESDRRIAIKYKGQRIRGTRNFNTASLRNGLRRLNHPDLHKQRAVLSCDL